jgi:hypothetical protein
VQNAHPIRSAEAVTMARAKPRTGESVTGAAGGGGLYEGDHECQQDSYKEFHGDNNNSVL